MSDTKTNSARCPLSDSAETSAETAHYCGGDEMRAVFKSNGRSIDFADVSFVLATILATISDRPSWTQKTYSQTSANETLRILARAREYIEAHLHESIRISDICEVSATSASKLERIFRRELHTSPCGYVLGRRLEAVRKELSDTSLPDKQIAHIAMDYGFNHLGRFSGAYREQFGELPSETLQAC